ncbi:MAG: ABC-2 transporter permease [Eubacteriales bacterium]
MKSSSFVKLDFYTIKPYFKSIIMLPAIAILLAATMKNVYFIVTMLAGYSWMVSIYPFSIAEKFNLDILYASLPGSRRQIVNGRYMFFVVLYLAAGALSIALSYILHMVLGYEFDIAQGAFIVVMIFPLVSLIAGLFYCLMFKFGYLKARFVNIIPIILIFIGGESMSTLFEENAAILSGVNPAYAMLASVALGAIFLFISMIVSRMIYLKKDF